MNEPELTKLATSMMATTRALLDELGPIRPRDGACCISKDSSLAVEFVAWRRGRSNLCDLEVRLLPRALPSDIPNFDIEECRTFYEEVASSPSASGRETALRGVQIIDLPRVSSSDLAGIRLLLTQEKPSLATPARAHTDIAHSRPQGVGTPGLRADENMGLVSKPLAGSRRFSVRSAVLDGTGRGRFRSILLDMPVQVVVGSLSWLPLVSAAETVQDQPPAGMHRAESPAAEPIRGSGTQPTDFVQRQKPKVEGLAVAGEVIEFAALSHAPGGSWEGPTEFVCEEVQEEFSARVEWSPDTILSLRFNSFAVPDGAARSGAFLTCTYRDAADLPLAEARAELQPQTQDKKCWCVTTTLRLVRQPGDKADVKKVLQAARPCFVIEPRT